MAHPHKMKKNLLEVGLTGGIASGKSTVTGILSELGLTIIDADAIAHKMVEPGGKAFQEILEHFGPSVLEGSIISRKYLAKVVFRDQKALQQLNAILHPLVIEEIERITGEYSKKKQETLLITEAALLIETGYYKRFDKIVIVSCSQETQLRRLMEREQIGREEALARINSQMLLSKKMKYADYVIDTDCSLSEVRHRTKELYFTLIDDLNQLMKDRDAKREDDK